MWFGVCTKVCFAAKDCDMRVNVVAVAMSQATEGTRYVYAFVSYPRG